MLRGYAISRLSPRHTTKGNIKTCWVTAQNGGCRFHYIVQQSPDGLAQSYILAEDFLNGAPSVMVLGDNIFFGHDLPKLLQTAADNNTGATIFGYHVSDPERYGVADFDENNRVKSITEKPDNPASNYAITGCILWMKPRQRGRGMSNPRPVGNWKSPVCYKAIWMTTPYP